MTAQERLERVLKDLDVLSQICSKAQLGAQKLDDKVEMQRTKSKMDSARSILKLMWYSVENADKFSENTEVCDKCGTTVSK